MASATVTLLAAVTRRWGPQILPSAMLAPRDYGQHHTKHTSVHKFHGCVSLTRRTYKAVSLHITTPMTLTPHSSHKIPRIFTDISSAEPQQTQIWIVTLPVSVPVECRRAVGCLHIEPRNDRRRHERMCSVVRHLGHQIALLDEGGWCSTCILHVTHTGQNDHPHVTHARGAVLRPCNLHVERLGTVACDTGQPVQLCRQCQCWEWIGWNLPRHGCSGTVD